MIVPRIPFVKPAPPSENIVLGIERELPHKRTATPITLYISTCYKLSYAAHDVRYISAAPTGFFVSSRGKAYQR
jgi:hypothetical protein